MLRMQREIEGKFERRRKLGSLRDFLVRKIAERQADHLQVVEVNKKEITNLVLKNEKSFNISKLQNKKKNETPNPSDDSSDYRSGTSSSSKSKQTKKISTKSRKRKTVAETIENSPTVADDVAGRIVESFASMVKPTFTNFKIPRISAVTKGARQDNAAGSVTTNSNSQIEKKEAEVRSIPTGTTSAVQVKAERPKVENNDSSEIVREDGEVEDATIEIKPVVRERSNSVASSSRSSVGRSSVVPIPRTLGDYRRIKNPSQPATPLEMMENHDRELLVKLIINVESQQRDWVHLSGMTRANYIGTGAMQKLSSNSRLYNFDRGHREEDFINGVRVMFPIDMAVQPEFQIGKIRFRPKLNEVPLESACVFAPQRIQLGRSFVRDYVSGLNLELMRIRFHSHGCIEEADIQWRKSEDVYFNSSRC